MSKKADEHGDGLGLTPPRDWQCTSIDAIWCPVHGDCTCSFPAKRRTCPLHGSGTNHPCGTVRR